MYLTNKYTKWYNNIITAARQRVNQPGYTEKHHIIPKSLGGTNDLTNLVDLTAKEHFICHLLLTKMLDDPVLRRKMYYASYMMVRGIRNKHYTPSAKVYEMVRQNMIVALKERPGPNLGRKMSEEFRKKQSELKKGVPRGPMSDEHKNKLRTPKTEEHKRKLSESRIGKSFGHKHSAETKSKMSSWQKGVAKPRLKCEHCEKEISDLNYKRWHGVKCKSRVY